MTLTNTVSIVSVDPDHSSNRSSILDCPSNDYDSGMSQIWTSSEDYYIMKDDFSLRDELSPQDMISLAG